MKQVLGYFLGFAIFIVGIPALMRLVSGMPSGSHVKVYNVPNYGNVYSSSMAEYLYRK
jgi:hypothetical protein